MIAWKVRRIEQALMEWEDMCLAEHVDAVVKRTIGAPYFLDGPVLYGQELRDALAHHYSGGKIDIERFIGSFAERDKYLQVIEGPLLLLPRDLAMWGAKGKRAIELTPQLEALLRQHPPELLWKDAPWSALVPFALLLHRPIVDHHGSHYDCILVTSGVDPRMPTERHIVFRFLSDRLEQRKVLPRQLREQTIQALRQNNPAGLLPYLDKKFRTRYTAVSWFGVPINVDVSIRAVKTADLIWSTTIEHGLNVYPTHDLSEQATAFWDETARLVAGVVTCFAGHMQTHGDIPASSLFSIPLRERQPVISDRASVFVLSE